MVGPKVLAATAPADRAWWGGAGLVGRAWWGGPCLAGPNGSGVGE